MNGHKAELVALEIEVLHEFDARLVGRLRLHALLNAHKDIVGQAAHCGEDVVLKAIGGLQENECASHVAGGGLDNVAHGGGRLFLAAGNEQESLANEFVGESVEAKEGAARLERIDNVVHIVAHENEARVIVLLHDAPQIVLCRGGEALGLVENDHFGARALLVAESDDRGAHNVDVAVVRGVQTENALGAKGHTLVDGVSGGFARQNVCRRGFAGAWRAKEEQVGDAVANAAHVLAEHVVEPLRSVGFGPHLL